VDFGVSGFCLRCPHCGKARKIDRYALFLTWPF
jgi:hypothetical protein